MYSCDSGVVDLRCCVEDNGSHKRGLIISKDPIFISFLKCNESSSLRQSIGATTGEAGHERHEHQGYKQKTFHRIQDIFWLFEDCCLLVAMDVNTFACTPKRVKVLVLLPSNELSNKQYNLLFGHMYVT